MSERIEVGDEVEILTGPRAGLLMDVYSMTEEDGCYLSGLVNECRTNLRLIRKSPAKLTPTVPPTARDWKPEFGEKVLVEALIVKVYDDWALVSEMTERCDNLQWSLPLSSIHPMTGRDGGK